jgi:hypothetical protein
MRRRLCHAHYSNTYTRRPEMLCVECHLYNGKVRMHDIGGRRVALPIVCQHGGKREEMKAPTTHTMIIGYLDNG